MVCCGMVWYGIVVVAWESEDHEVFHSGIGTIVVLAVGHCPGRKKVAKVGGVCSLAGASHHTVVPPRSAEGIASTSL